MSFLVSCTGSTSPTSSASSQAATADPALVAPIEKVVREAMSKHHLRTLIVQVTKDGHNVYTGAMGTSMCGVPATPDMHFRIGSFGFTYRADLRQAGG